MSGPERAPAGRFLADIRAEADRLGTREPVALPLAAHLWLEAQA